MENVYLRHFLYDFFFLIASFQRKNVIDIFLCFSKCRLFNRIYGIEGRGFLK